MKKNRWNRTVLLGLALLFRKHDDYLPIKERRRQVYLTERLIDETFHNNISW